MTIALRMTRRRLAFAWSAGGDCACCAVGCASSDAMASTADTASTTRRMRLNIPRMIASSLMAQWPLAYLNPEFLDSNEARPIRILAEYLEPLRRFKEQKIQDTVVFFGSARVDSRERAERALQTLRARGERSADEHYQLELTKSRKALEWARYYEEARELARLL